MNEDRKKRGIKNHKILMTVAICALFLGSSNTFAARSTSHENHGVTCLLYTSDAADELYCV